VYTYNLGPHISASDIIPGSFIGYSRGVDPRTGGLLQSAGMSTHLSAPLTDEVLLGVEHALLPDFVVSVDLTYRKLHNLLDTNLLVFDNSVCSGNGAFDGDCLDTVGRRSTAADYQLNTVRTQLPNGQFEVLNYYQLKPGITTRNGNYLYNGGDEQEYKGATVGFNKRLANRWMLRGNFTYSDWKWSKVPAADRVNPTAAIAGGEREGDQVLQGSGTGSGSFGNVYINSKWAYSVNGMYQIAPDRPWGFNVAMAANGRQGYPLPYFTRVTLGSSYPGGTREYIRATDRPDTFRMDTVNDVDARVEKEFNFSSFGATVGIDCFNLFNESTVLQRRLRLNLANSDYIFETLSPRVFRVGVRLNFR